jgi:hypothetical protein
VYPRRMSALELHACAAAHPLIHMELDGAARTAPPHDGHPRYSPDAYQWVGVGNGFARQGWLSLGPALLTQTADHSRAGGERRVEPTSSAGGLSQRRGRFGG